LYAPLVPPPEEEDVPSNILEATMQSLATQAAAAGGTYTALMIDQNVSDEAKLIASAITQAGAQLAHATLLTG
jgi:hypothetical protein